MHGRLAEIIKDGYVVQGLGYIENPAKLKCAASFHEVGV